MNNEHIIVKLTPAQRVTIHSFVSSLEHLDLEELSLVSSIKRAMKIELLSPTSIQDQGMEEMPLLKEEVGLLIQTMANGKHYNGEMDHIILPLYETLVASLAPTVD